MGKIKDTLYEICSLLCSLLDSIKYQSRLTMTELTEIGNDQKKIKDELVALNNMLSDFGEMLEEQQTAGQDAQLLRVMPAENAGKEALFVVTGDELANLLEACSGATLRMKKKEADKK